MGIRWFDPQVNAMEPIDHSQYIILSLLVVSWCALHSIMITPSVTEYLKRRLTSKFRFYRLFYNVIAILTLIPVAFFVSSTKTQVVIDWSGCMRIGQVILVGLAVMLFYLGGKHYDARQVLGIRQIKERNSDTVITDTGELDMSGVLSVTRHPWYAAAMLFIWSRQLDIAAILVNILLTFYLIVGTYLEEKKLVREFGEQYTAYQKKVSMLIPIKWIRSKI